MFVFARTCLFFKPIHHWISPLLVLPLLLRVCQWKPFRIPVEDSFKKAFVEEWVFISDEPSDGQNAVEVTVLHSTDHSDYIRVTPRTSKHPTSLPWETANPKIKRVFGSELRHHYLRCSHGQNATSFIHVNSVPFLSIWNCRFQMMKSCSVTKNLTPQEMIFLLHGPN